MPPRPCTPGSTPIEAGAPLRHARPEAAAGTEAMWSIAEHGWRELGAARAADTLRRVNQPDGFDCPGCAWPEPEARSALEFCENGAKAIADEATTRACDPDFFARWSVAELRQQSDLWLNRQGRLTHPMVLRPGATHYAPATWDQALDGIAATLRALPAPDDAIFYTSGRTSNEAAWLWQLFARAFGTNNLPDCANLCHEASGVALTETIGVSKGTVSLADIEGSDLVLVIGQNPGTNHPRMLTSLQRARRNGARIIAINPIEEVGLLRFRHPKELEGIVGSGTPLADLYVRPTINGDVALLLGVSKRVFELEDEAPGTVLDHAFLRDLTVGVDTFRDHVRGFTWETLVERSGVPLDVIDAVARAYASARSAVACWAMGVTQHENGVDNVREIVNLMLLRGNIGRPGAGVLPVRGHSNVQGDRTMGITSRPKPELLAAIERVHGFSPPTRPGLDTVAALRAMGERPGMALLCLGGNLLSASPDSEAVAAALGRCRLTVQVSTKLNRSHLYTGSEAWILPCLGRTDVDVQATGPQVVSVEDSMGFVHASRGHLTPASAALRAEPWIVAHLAARTLGDFAHLPWTAWADDYRAIRGAIADAVPGHHDYDQRLGSGGFLLPNSARERQFPAGRARFTLHEPPDPSLPPGHLRMMTIRSHDQYNTTIYGLKDRYRGLAGQRRVVLISPAELAALGRRDGEIVDVISTFRGVERRANGFHLVAYDLPRGCCAAYFPEANVLVPLEQAGTRSGTPASKSIVVRFTEP